MLSALGLDQRLAHDCHLLAVEGHGEKSHIACVVMTNLSGMLHKGDGEELVEARELAEKAYAGFGERLGPKHQNTLAARNMLAVILRNQGELETAEEHSLALLELSEGEFPEGHPSPAVYELNLGICWLRMERHEEALPQLLAAHAKLSGMAEPGVVHKAVPYLIEYYEATGDEARAEQWRSQLQD